MSSITRRPSQKNAGVLRSMDSSRTGAASQYPYVNIFRHCAIAQWRKCSKAGDVTTLMDKTVKSTVYRVAGSVPAANYIQLPQTASQSLSLTGRHMYILCRPLANRFFVVHLDLVVADEQIAVRVSLGNVFRVFKATHTWLQLPVVDLAKASRKPGSAMASSSPRWTLLCVDCQLLLQTYLNRQFSHVKSIRVCANQLVKNIFTSDYDYDHLAAKLPSVSRKLRQAGERIPLPREMSFFLPPGQDWDDHYDYIRIPLNQGIGVAVPPAGKPKSVLPEVLLEAKADGGKPSGVSECGTIKVFAEDGSRPLVTVHRKRSRKSEHPVEDRVPTDNQRHAPQSSLKCLQPDPILDLKKVAGFGGGSEKEVIWSKDGVHVFYPCHAVVVGIDVTTHHQQHLVGHSDKVSCIATNYPTNMLATGQQGPMAAVRLWDMSSCQCRAVFKAHHSGIHALALSYSGGMLCGVGRDAHHRQMVVVWNVEQALVDGKTEVIAQASTDFDVQRIKIAAFDDTRMVSCGRENVRFWRVRNGELRSAPVNLGSHHGVVVNDVTFEGVSGRSMDDPCQQRVFACTSTGLVLQINYRQLRVERVFQVASPAARTPSVPVSASQCGILSIAVNEAFAATGSDDGFLRLWPLDFSRVFMEAEHETAVSAVAISADGLKVACGTSGRQLGVVDVENRSYRTLTRSHNAPIVSAAISAEHKLIATASEDGVVCAWEAGSLQQLYTFLAPMDTPTEVAFHPRHQCIAVGYTSGYVRLYHTKTTSVVAEHRCTSSAVNGLVFVPSGRRLVCASRDGTLSLYDTELQALKPLRVLANTTAKQQPVAAASSTAGRGRCGAGGSALSLSGDGHHVAFAGPSPHMVSTVDALTLDEVMHIDISAMTSSSSQSHDSLDSALHVQFSAQSTGQLLVYTVEGRLLRLAATTGQLLSEVSSLHNDICTSLAVCTRGQLMLSGGDRQLRVWDYHMRYDVNYQAFLGHSEEIRKILVSSDGKTVLSFGDSLFVWTCHGLAGDVHKSMDLASGGMRSGRACHMSPEQPWKPPSPCRPHTTVPVLEQLDASEVGDRSVAEEPPVEAENVHSDALLSDATSSDRSSSNSSDGSNSESESDALEHIQVVQARKPRENPVALPTVVKHYVRDFSTQVTSKSAKPFLPSSAHQSLSLKHVIGFNGRGRGNLIWDAPSGIMAYSLDSMVIVEELADGRQQHFRGHCSEVSTMCLRQDGKVIVSASGASGLENSTMCVWTVATGQCTKILTPHERNIMAVRYSPDDSLLVSMGCYEEPLLVVWETGKCTPLATANIGTAMHDVVWDPFRTGELVSVGDDGRVHFWMLDGGDEESEGDSQDGDVSLKVHSTSLPVEARHTARDQACHMTCAAYATRRILLVGSSTGIVSAWDTDKNVCFAHWLADESELTYMFASTSTLITASAAGLLKYWSLQGLGNLLESSDGSSHDLCQISADREVAVDAAVVSAVFNGHLSLGLVATSSSAVWCINWSDLSALRMLSGHSDQVSCLTSWTSSNSCLATASMDGGLRVWLARERELLVHISVQDVGCTSVSFGPGRATGAGIVASSNSIVTSSKSHGVQQRSSLLYDALVSEEAPKPEMSSAEASATGTSGLCVCGYEDGTLRLFDVKEQQLQLKTAPHSTAITRACISSDGGVIISGDVSGQLLVSNVLTGMTVRRLTQHGSAPITDVDVAPADMTLATAAVTSHDAGKHIPPLSGLWLAASADSRISVWSCDWKRDRCDLIDWLTSPTPTENRFSQPWPYRKHDKSAFANLPPTLARFSPSDGGLIVYTGYSLDNVLSIYSLNTKKVVKQISLSYWPSCLAISSASGCCFLGSREGVIRSVSMATGSYQDTVTDCGGMSSLCCLPQSAASRRRSGSGSGSGDLCSRQEQLVSVASTGFLVWNVALHM